MAGATGYSKLSDFAKRPTLFNLDSDLHDGQLIALQRIDGGTAQVFENRQYRWLSQNDVVQTVMLKHRPQQLVLPHLHGFALGLYWRPQTLKVLEMGLGGGALRRFLQYYYPQVHVDTVEINQSTIDIYQQYFCPQPDVSGTIVREEAHTWLGHYSKRNYDLIFIDLFSPQGTPTCLARPAFYQSCIRNLNEQGVLFLNCVPQYGEELEPIIGHLQALGRGNLSHFSVPGYRNRILVQGPQTLPRVDFTPALQRFIANHGVDLNQLIQIS